MENNNLGSRNYKQLDEFLETEFIPKYLKMNREKNSNGKYKIFPAIEYDDLVKLHFNDNELRHVIEYLENVGIVVVGITPMVFTDNYDYARMHKDPTIPEYDPEQDDVSLMRDYQRTLNLQTRDKVILNNIRLVDYVAYRFFRFTKINIHELQSYGYEGLIDAIESFDSEHENSFFACAYLYIKNSIIRGLKKDYGINHAKYVEFLKYKEIVEQELGRTMEEDSRILDEILRVMIKDKVITEKGAYDLKTEIIGNEYHSIDNSNVQQLMDEESNFEDGIFLGMLKEEVEEVLKILLPRQAQVITLRFGLDGGEPKTLREVGKILNIGPEAVRQIEKKAMRRLRHPEPSCRLRSYLNEEANIYESLPTGKKM